MLCPLQDALCEICGSEAACSEAGKASHGSEALSQEPELRFMGLHKKGFVRQGDWTLELHAEQALLVFRP